MTGTDTGSIVQRSAFRVRIKDIQDVGILECERCAATVRDLVKQSREANGKADDIENAVYDLKAVNPHRKQDVDRRTLSELLDLVEAKGLEISEALKKLRALI